MAPEALPVRRKLLDQQLLPTDAFHRFPSDPTKHAQRFSSPLSHAASGFRGERARKQHTGTSTPEARIRQPTGLLVAA